MSARYNLLACASGTSGLLFLPTPWIQLALRARPPIWFAASSSRKSFMPAVFNVFAATTPAMPPPRINTVVRSAIDCGEFQQWRNIEVNYLQRFFSACLRTAARFCLSCRVLPLFVEWQCVKWQVMMSMKMMNTPISFQNTERGCSSSGENLRV